MAIAVPGVQVSIRLDLASWQQLSATGFVYELTWVATHPGPTHVEKVRGWSVVAIALLMLCLSNAIKDSCPRTIYSQHDTSSWLCVCVCVCRALFPAQVITTTQKTVVCPWCSVIAFRFSHLTTRYTRLSRTAGDNSTRSRN